MPGPGTLHWGRGMGWDGTPIPAHPGTGSKPDLYSELNTKLFKSPCTSANTNH